MGRQKKIDELYHVTLALKDAETYNAEGETLLEAMSKIKVGELIKVLGTITATYKDKKVVRVCNASRLQRIFGKDSKLNEVALTTYAKFLNSGL